MRTDTGSSAIRARPRFIARTWLITSSAYRGKVCPKILGGLYYAVAFALDGLALRGVHAPDERIPLAVFERGVATMIRVVRALAATDPAAP